MGEFIRNKETGLLIADIEDTNGYVSAISYLRDNPEQARDFCVNAQDLLRERHSEEAFLGEVKKAQL